MRHLTHLSLFSGIGGIDLAAEWAGFVTVGQCENAVFPTKILEKHWPDVPRWSDIRDVTASSFKSKTGLYTVDLISGRIPCQPFSVAGQQKGFSDDRYLWPEMLRVIRELKPCWVVAENVPGILRIAGAEVCEDLERAGYSVAVYCYEAAAVGAPHRRERVFFVAYAASTIREWSVEHVDPSRFSRLTNRSGIMADAESERLEGDRSDWQQIADTRYKKTELKRRGIPNPDDRRRTLRRHGKFPAAAKIDRQKSHNGRRTPEHVAGERRSAQPCVGGMADGLPAGLDGPLTWLPEPDIPRVTANVQNRTAKLKALGNAVVPQQVYPILRAIAEIEPTNNH